MNPYKLIGIGNRGLLTLILLGIFTISLFSIKWDSNIFHSGGTKSILDMLYGLITLDMSPSFLGMALQSSWITLNYAVASISLAVLIGFPLGILGSGILTPSRYSKMWTIYFVRCILSVLRSIHELVWAWFFVVAIGLTPIAAILALAIPYSSILGRIYADIISDVPNDALKSLRASGASEVKILFYGRLPHALPDMLSYTFYRFECGIRSAAILSFIGIRGLGYQIQISLDELLYNQVWTLLIFLILLITIVDIWSSSVRKSLAK